MPLDSQAQSELLLRFLDCGQPRLYLITRKLILGVEAFSRVSGHVAGLLAVNESGIDAARLGVGEVHGRIGIGDNRQVACPLIQLFHRNLVNPREIAENTRRGNIPVGLNL